MIASEGVVRPHTARLNRDRGQAYTAVCHESGHPRRRARHAPQRGDRARPKPMVEIGGRPILWHIMKIYSAHGVNEFMVCLGYKGYVIKEYFANYFLHILDVTFDLGRNAMEVHQRTRGAVAGDARRHRRRDDDRRPAAARARLPRRRGLLLDLWRRRRRRRHRRAARLPPRHGELATRHRRAARRAASARSSSTASKVDAASQEKPHGDGGWINGGFFVLSPGGPRLHRRRRHWCGSASRSSAWRATASWPPIATTASGSRWTRCATSASSKSSGQAGKRAVEDVVT